MSYTVINQQVKAGKEQFLSGNYTNAEKHFEAALIESQKYPQPNEYTANQIKTLGIYYFAAQNYEKSINLFKEALGLEEKLFGAKSLKISQTLNQLGFIYHVSGDTVEAEKIYKQALEIEEQTHFAKKPDVDSETEFNTHLLLSILYCENGRHEDGFKICQNATQKISKTGLQGTNSLYKEFQTIAETYCEKGEFSAAKITHQWLLDGYMEWLKKEYLGDRDQ